MLSIMRKTLFLGAVAVLALALSPAYASAATSPTRQRKTAGADVATTCPLGVPGSKLAEQLTPEGMALDLTAKPGEVQALRDRVAKLATQARSQNASVEAMSTMGRSVMGPRLGAVMDHAMWQMLNQRDWSMATIGEPVGPQRVAEEEAHTPIPLTGPGMGMQGPMMGSGMGMHGTMMGSGNANHGAMMAGRIVPWSKIATKDIPQGVEVRLSQPAAVEREELQAAVQQRTHELASAAACRLESLLRPVHTSEQGGTTVQ